MGNKISESHHCQQFNNLNSSRNEFRLFSQSLPSLVSGLSSFSFGSFTRSQSSSVTNTKPLSKLSRRRRRYRNHTVSDSRELAKTAWPVSTGEAYFLPDFKIGGDVCESHFEIKQLISKGAFGSVYEAIHKETKKKCAMKILRKSNIINQQCVTQVKDEVRIQKMCGHHNCIVAMPYHWQNKHALFIVTEYLPNGDLLEFCNEYGPLPEDLCRIFITEIASAIDFLHNAGVIFRDVKGENVMLDCEYHCKLGDFGLAKWLHYGERTYTICGTLHYMAPEIFQGSYGHAADWWSLGILAYFLFTAKVVKVEEDGRLPEEPKISTKARDLVMRLLNRDPGRRLRSLQALRGSPFYHAVPHQLNPEDLVKGMEKRVKEGTNDFPGFDSSEIENN